MSDYSPLELTLGNPSDNPWIAAGMLDARPGEQSAFLINQEIDEQYYEVLSGHHDHSFVSQMSDALAAEPPIDAYALTWRSAIPLADAIRGYYGKLGHNYPDITYIRIPDKHYYQMMFDKGTPEDFSQPVLRDIKKRFSQYDSVCVVEEFTYSGWGIKHAADYLRAVGVREVRAICGQWYDSVAHPESIDVLKMTSSQADFMHRVGELACS